MRTTAERNRLDEARLRYARAMARGRRDIVDELLADVIALDPHVDLPEPADDEIFERLIPPGIRRGRKTRVVHIERRRRQR